MAATHPVPPGELVVGMGQDALGNRRGGGNRNVSAVRTSAIVAASSR
jgi:hypothetical protein